MEQKIMDYLLAFSDLFGQIRKTVKQLLTLEEQKYDALKQVDIKELMQINSVEEEVLQFMNSLEKRRQTMIAGLAAYFQCGTDISLTELIAYFPVEMQDVFFEMRKAIKHDTNKLDITMRENTEMIRTGLEIVDFTLSFANNAAKDDTYDLRQGAVSSDKNNIHLINQIA